MNAKKTRPAPVRGHDHQGRPIVKVAVDPEGTRWATLDADDFDALPAGLSLSWVLNPNRRGGAAYVKAPAKSATGNLVNVGRIVLDAGPRRRVTYRTEDRLDLRKANLKLSKGGHATRDDRTACRKIRPDDGAHRGDQEAA